jgi:hypothetical protein
MNSSHFHGGAETLKKVWSLGIMMAAVLLVSLTFSVAAAGPPDDKDKQLKDRHDRSTALFEIEGVFWTDADEQNNVIVVGVRNEGLAKAVKKKAEEVGIPADAVQVVTAEPIVPVATLTDRIRPLRGGLQIAFSNYLCTESFNATRSGVAGFAVASHCTDKRGEVGTKHYQPTRADANLIGTESADPQFFTKGICPISYKCRWSDSAFDQLASGVTADLGFIARPDGVNTGSLTIAGSFRVVGEAPSNATVGETLNKVGRTTGWSQGPVTRSCVHTGVFGSNILLLCQDFVRASVAGGDSGSPVFRITDTNDVQLYGILWGGGGSDFVYSPMANIQRVGELGPLTTCASGFTC